MNIFKKIALANKISKAIKKCKKIIDENQGLAKKVQKVLENVKMNIEELTNLLPELKEVIQEILKAFEIG